jgi:hypothetical protein
MFARKPGSGPSGSIMFDFEAPKDAHRPDGLAPDHAARRYACAVDRTYNVYAIVDRAGDDDRGRGSLQ